MISITKMNILKQIVIFNGLYDILCALSILKIINIPILNQLHLSMFIILPSNKERKWLAYWIFINGCIRLLSNNKYLISISYLIEALVIASECFIFKRIKIVNGLFVSISSLVLAILVLMHFY